MEAKLSVPPHDNVGQGISADDEVDNRRMAIIFSSDECRCGHPLEQYYSFLKGCGFKDYPMNLPQDVKELTALLPPTQLQRAQQVIVIVLCNGAYNLSVKDFLLAMKNSIYARVDQFILFCRICAGEPHDESNWLSKKYPRNDYEFGEILVAYYSTTAENVESLFQELHKQQGEKWITNCISKILYDLKIYTDLLIFPTKHKTETNSGQKNRIGFLQDFVWLSENNLGQSAKLGNVDNNEMESNLKEYARFIYDNRRIRGTSAAHGQVTKLNNPRALIILHFDQEPGPIFKTMDSDRRNLVELFMALKYDVKDVHTGAFAKKSVEETVRDFAKDSYHGDSCVLVVLSDSELGGKGINSLYGIMASGKELLGKPRLVIVQEWKSRSILNGSTLDGGPHLHDSIPEILFEADELREKLEVKSGKIIHPHSGLMFGYSATDSTDAGGSPFILALCETFLRNGSRKDVLTMISLINDHERLKNATTVPRWCLQPIKLFYLTDTGILKEDRGAGIATQSYHGSESVSKFADRKGVALIITDESFHAIESYQMFLEAVSFEVHTESLNAGSANSIPGFVKSSIDKDVLAVVLVVQNVPALKSLEEVIISMMELKCTNESLLIYVEINGDYGVPPSPQFSEATRPNFNVARYYGSQANVDNMLNRLLSSPSKIYKNGPLVGFDFVEANRQEIMVHVSDQVPLVEWIDRSDPCCHQFIYSNGGSNQGMDKYQINVPSSANVSARPRALVIHNVVFKEKSPRFESLFDCQKISKSLTNLGYCVSTKSNLSAKKILRKKGKEGIIAEFADSQRHGNSCVLVIMSHGQMGEIIGIDNAVVSEDKIIKTLGESKSLENCQKLVVIQACRNSKDLKAEPSGLSMYPNMIVAHSTSPDNYSVRLPLFGSRFIQSLCIMLDMCAQKLDVATLSTGVNYFMMNCFDVESYCQLPCWMVSTRRRFFLAERPSTEDRVDGMANLLDSAEREFSQRIKVADSIC